jgi:hypothetical protein
MLHIITTVAATGTTAEIGEIIRARIGHLGYPQRMELARAIAKEPEAFYRSIRLPDIVSRTAKSVAQLEYDVNHFSGVFGQLMTMNNTNQAIRTTPPIPPTPFIPPRPLSPIRHPSPVNNQGEDPVKAMEDAFMCYSPTDYELVDSDTVDPKDTVAKSIDEELD